MHGEDAGYPRDRPGPGGPVGSPTDRGKLVPGYRKTGEAPVPVITPDHACGSTTLMMVCRRVAPSASDASRYSRGTCRSVSSTVMMTTGMVRTAMVIAAQQGNGQAMLMMI